LATLSKLSNILQINKNAREILCSIGKVNISLSAYVADCSWTDVDSALNKLFTQATAESADCKNKTTIAAKHKISFAC